MTAEPISLEVMARLAEELSPEDLEQLAAWYLADSAAMLRAMDAAAEAGDGDGWRRAAHRLAGGAGGVGAQLVEAGSRALMDAPLPDDAAAVLARLRADVDASCAELRAMLEAMR